jgi:hypothetical protein
MQMTFTVDGDDLIEEYVRDDKAKELTTFKHEGDYLIAVSGVSLLRSVTGDALSDNTNKRYSVSSLVETTVIYMFTFLMCPSPPLSHVFAVTQLVSLNREYFFLFF